MTATRKRLTRALLVTGGIVLAAWPAAAATLPPHNPPANVAFNPNPFGSGPCSRVQNDGTVTLDPYVNTPACDAYVLLSVNHARSLEKVKPMALPTNFSKLTPAQQIFVVLNLERVDRALAPYVGMSTALTAAAQVAARENRDPRPPANFKTGPLNWGGIWAGGISALTSDFVWMYNDGWTGSRAATSNLACTSARAPLCWAHRNIILAVNTKSGLYCTNCLVGAGYAPPRDAKLGPFGSYSAVVAQPAAGTHPALSFTWARDVKPFLPH